MSGYVISKILEIWLCYTSSQIVIQAGFEKLEIEKIEALVDLTNISSQ
ncbi:hypothetical protein PRO82_000749 [Candidatus Protochlamydia amoebophila]|nr:hypothetical protein [Candidatus Protochlamydia amoebophila]